MRFVICLIMISSFILAAPTKGGEGLLVGEDKQASAESSLKNKTYNAGISSGGINVFRTAWMAILKEAGIRANYIEDDFITRNDMFIKGDLVLECCSMPRWHDSPEERQVQIYTNSFFSTYEHLVSRKDLNLDEIELNDVTKYQVGMVRGFHHRGDNLFQNPKLYETISEMLTAVHKGEVEIAFVNNQEFGKFKRQTKNESLVMGQVWEHIPFAIRVRKNESHLVPLINESIQRLRGNGTIARLVGEALRKQFEIN